MMQEATHNKYSWLALAGRGIRKNLITSHHHHKATCHQSKMAAEGKEHEMKIEKKMVYMLLASF